MWGKLKANAKSGQGGQSDNFEEKDDIECGKKKIPDKTSGELHLPRIMKAEEKHPRAPSETSNATESSGNIGAIFEKSVQAKNFNVGENCVAVLDSRFSLFEDVLPTAIDVRDCEIRNSVRSNIKVEYGLSPSRRPQDQKLKLLKPEKAKPSTTDERNYCKPKPVTRAKVVKKTIAYTKPCRIKKLPAKLTDSRMDLGKPMEDATMPKLEAEIVPSKPSLDVTLNLPNLTEIVAINCVKSVANVEKSVEQLSNGPLVNGVPNNQIDDTESKKLKITMTKVGDGVWEQVLKTNIKKRRYNSWKKGKLLKVKKKRKIEQIDHDYTPNYTPPASKSQFGTRNVCTDPIAKSSPPRRRTTPNRLKDCVEVPPSPSKTCLTSALDPPLPSPPKGDKAVNNLIKPLKSRTFPTKSSKKLMKIEAENLLKMPSRSVAKVKFSTPGSPAQLLPRVLARKGSEPVKKRAYNKKATLKMVMANDLKPELATVPDSADSSQTEPLDQLPPTIDASNQKKSPPKSIKEKKALKKNLTTSTTKPLTKEKTSLKLKARAMQQTVNINAKVAKLTAKAKAIRLQIKAEKKKSQTARKATVKEISKKREAALNGNSPDNDTNASASCDMPTAAIASPRKMSLISQLKNESPKTSVGESNTNACVTSLAFLDHPASLSLSTASSQPISNEVARRSRGRPRSLLPRPAKKRTIRLSRNGLRIGRPPKTADEESSFVGSQIQFLQSAVANCFTPSNSFAVDEAKPIMSRPDCFLPKNRSNAIPQSNAQPTVAASVPGPRAPAPLSSYAFLPQSSLTVNNPKRSSIRQTECAFRYREIAVKKQDNYIQIVLMSSTRVKNGLNCQVMHELSMALSAAKSDPKCSLVVINGTGSVFCSGVDLISLSMDLGQGTAEKTSTAIRDFCKALFTFPKPLIAAVNGAAVGLGVTFLPFFDLVYASDKATFYTPYCKLGQIPEGGATFTLPSIMGYARANALLLEGRRITATEAYDTGLITQVLWPATFMEEVIPRVQALANRPLQAMESTKALIRYHEQSKLEVTLDTECRVLLQQWSSDECRTAIRDFLTSEEVV